VTTTCHCTCGGSGRCTGNADHWADIWESIHTGPGHLPCDARTARRARDRQQRGPRPAARAVLTLGDRP
jgi:hypothetical protein